jgi:hypothetical protein
LFRFYRISSFFFSLLLSAAGFVFAEQGVKFYEKKEIIQRINWEQEDDVLKYQLVIEKKDNAGGENSFTQVFDGNTEETSVEISLPPGEYRYRVLVYDLLGRQSPVPEWSRLTVFPALKPEITSVNPKSAALSGTSMTINLKGKNLLPDSEIFFLPAESGAESLEDILSQSILLGKNNYRVDNDSAGVQLNLDGFPLEKGFYDIVIKNPGGLFTVWRNYQIVDETISAQQDEKGVRKFAFTTTEGYAPLIPVYGLFNDIIIGDSILPAGVVSRLGVNLENSPKQIFGVELAAYWHYLKPIQDSAIISGNLINIQINLLYQIKIINQRVGITARVGGGMVYFFGLQFPGSYSNDFKVNESLIPMGDISLTVSYFFSKIFFLEFGVEYAHIFSADDRQPAYIRPLVCFGFNL